MNQEKPEHLYTLLGTHLVPGRAFRETIFEVCFHPQDNTKLFSAGLLKTAYIWNLRDPTSDEKVLRNRKTVLDVGNVSYLRPSLLTVDVSPKGDFLAFGTEKGDVPLFKIEDDERIDLKRILKGKRMNYIESVRFNDDGKILLSCSERGDSIHLWNVETCTMKYSVYCSHSTDGDVYGISVNSALFYSDDILISSGSDGNCKLWDIRAKNLKSYRRFARWPKCVQSYDLDREIEYTDRVRSMSVHKPSKTIICSMGNHSYAIDLRVMKCYRCYDGISEGEIREVNIHPSGKVFLLCTVQESIRIVDILTKKVMHAMEYEDPKFNKVYARFSKNGNSFATAGNDGCVRMWKSNLSFPKTVDQNNKDEVERTRFVVKWIIEEDLFVLCEDVRFVSFRIFGTGTIFRVFRSLL